MSRKSSSNMTKEEIQQAFHVVKKKKGGGKALEIMKIIPYFAPKNIPIKMFLGLVDSEEELRFAIKLLKEYSIVDSDQGETVLNVGKLVQRVLRANLETQENKEEILKKALEIIIAYGVDSSSLDHAISIWSYASAYQELVKESSLLPSDVVNEFGKDHRYEDAARFGFETYVILKKMIGAKHPDTLKLQHNMRVLLGANDTYKETLKILLKFCFEKDMKIEVKTEVLDSLLTILKQMCEMAEYDDALPIYESILENRQVSEASDETILTAWKDYARLLAIMGKHRESLEILRDLLQKKSEVSGVDTADAVQMKNDIAHGLMKQCKYNEALEWFQEVFNKRKEILGENHPDTLRSKRNIGLVFQHEGRYDEALAIYEETAELYKKISGEDHPDTLATLANLATLFQLKKEYPKTMELTRYVYQKRCQVLGSQHKDTLISLFNLAALLLEQKKNDEGLEMLQEVAKGYNVVLGPKDPETLKVKTEIKYLLHLSNSFLENVKENKVNAVAMFLKSGVCLNQQDPDGYTPLHFAVGNACTPIVFMLVNSGADVSKASIRGSTPIHIAALQGHSQILDILLQRGNSSQIANCINSKSSTYGNTALHTAASKGVLEMVKSLLKHGAIYNPENKKEETPLDMSVDRNVTDLLKLVRELFEDAKEGKTETISKLKAIKPDEFLVVTSARNDQGKTLLQVAITNKHKDIATELLKLLKKA